MNLKDGNLIAQWNRLNSNRSAQMQKLRKRGWTLKRIGVKYGLTRQRVSQILSRP